jgi:hypothetical protein
MRRYGKIQTDRTDELREFFVVVRRALLLIVRWIEQRYELGD